MTRFANLPEGPFDALLVDPPWAYSNSKTIRGLAESHYRTLSLEGLKALPVEAMAAPTAVLVMWCTWPQLTQGLELMRAWGFTYKTGLPWVKTYDGARPAIGCGWWLRGVSEPILVGVRGAPGAPDRSGELRLGLLGDLLLTAPRGRHSAKPMEIHDLAEEHDRSSRLAAYRALCARAPAWLGHAGAISCRRLRSPRSRGCWDEVGMAVDAHVLSAGARHR